MSTNPLEVVYKGHMTGFPQKHYVLGMIDIHKMASHLLTCALIFPILHLYVHIQANNNALKTNTLPYVANFIPTGESADGKIKTGLVMTHHPV